MRLFTIKNTELTVALDSIGAVLHSIQKDGTEHLWIRRAALRTGSWSLTGHVSLCAWIWTNAIIFYPTPVRPSPLKMAPPFL